MSKKLIIIPAYNEAGSIGDVILDVRQNLPEASILVVNDGSKDSTSAKARSYAKNYENVFVLDHPYNLGIGATMQTGYLFAYRMGFDIAVQVDGDGQHRADNLVKLIDPIESGEADMVIGSRFLGLGDYKASLARGAGIKIFSKLVSLIISEKFTDTTSGFRAVNRKIIEFYKGHYPDDYPEVEVLVLLHRKGYKMMEVPVEMSERSAGTSSITPIQSVYYMVKVLLAIFIDLIKKID